MLAARLVTAAVLLVLLTGALFGLPNAYWSALLLAGLLIAGLEWAALAGYSRAWRWVFAAILLASSLALFQAVRSHGAAAVEAGVYGVAAAFWIGVAPPWLVAAWHVRNRLILGMVGWILLVPTWLALATLQVEAGRLLMLLGVVWIADSAAYVTGRRFGRRRLAPRISPGKTWEGVIGACVAVAVYYGLLRAVFAVQEPWLGRGSTAVLFAVIVIMSVQGDLFESWMKRQAGVKDSGTLLPGHGGMLDRIDALTASLPLAGLWLVYLDSSAHLQS